MAKGVAILLVILTHVGIPDRTRMMLAFPFWVNMAVPLFMLVSGFVFARSFERRGISSVGAAFRPSVFIPSILRLAIPYLLIFPVEAMKGGGSAVEIVKWAIVGGWGPGSYYYPVMMQFLVAFPFVYVCFRKNRKVGLALCLFADIAYDVIQQCVGVPDGIYRLIGLRYLGLIGVGVSLAMQNGTSCIGGRMKNAVVGSLFAVGGLFIVATQYMGITPGLYPKWTSTSLVASLILLPVACRLFSNLQDQGGVRILEVLWSGIVGDISSAKGLFLCGWTCRGGPFSIHDPLWNNCAHSLHERRLGV